MDHNSNVNAGGGQRLRMKSSGDTKSSTVDRHHQKITSSKDSGDTSSGFSNEQRSGTPIGALEK
jgi:hypothetical protein